MSIKLTYFDFSGSRGEECRLALHLAGLDFVDDRVKGADWAARKPNTPWGAMPVLEVDGKQLGQSNAILCWIGRAKGLLPSEPWEAARHEAVLCAGEDLRNAFQPALREKNPVLKKAAREAFAAGYLQDWARNLEAQIVGPFVGGSILSVADLKAYICVNWFVSGVVDHIEPTVFASFPKVMALHAAVAKHPGVVGWSAR